MKLAATLPGSRAQPRGLDQRHRRRVVQETAGLMLPQPGVGPVETEQFVVRALLGDLAVVEHDQLVHARDRAQPMRDHERGPALHEPPQRLLDKDFALRVQRAGRLVQQQDRRVTQDRPGQRDSLPLPAGQPYGAITRDDWLDNTSLYWLTNTATSAARLYWQQAITGGNFYAPADVSLPAAVTVFPEEYVQAPRSWTEQAYHNLIYFNEAERGGHFSAWEQPQLLSEELRGAFRTLR